MVENEPLLEATSMDAFVVGQLLELFPSQAEGCREGLKDLQDVRQLSGEVIGRGLLCFVDRFGNLGQQRPTAGSTHIVQLSSFEKAKLTPALGT
jgi:hypothetical protein